MDQIERRILITEGGQQIPVETGAGMISTFFFSDDQVKEEVKLDVTEAEFEKIKKQALTNKIPAAILRSKKAK
ncbi:hypothetical protein [Mycolicibacterium wolinskyi]|uniref:hypothetical protein n=1 Tax=Mycolicibacterium wolinskyi TaxID=59750 RepID=UPI003917AA4C